MASVIVGVVILAGVIAGLLSLGLVRSAAQAQAQRALAQQADVAASVINEQAAIPGRDPAIGAILRSQNIPTARVSKNGAVSGSPQTTKALTTDDVTALLAGQSVSGKATVEGRIILVEGRPLAQGGGIVLSRAVSDAVGPANALLRRQLVALLIGVGVAAIAGVVLARWVAGPLRRVSLVAQRLTTGKRDARVSPEGPSEVAQVADSVNTLADALAVSESRERAFLLSITHELRTPLTAVRGFAEAVADGVATGEAARQAGTVIQAESTRLERLIDDLLDLARLGAQDFSINRVPVDLTVAMTAAATVWQARCSEVGVEFLADLPGAPLVIDTDAARARQIVDNLIENALRVTPAGRSIQLRLRPDGDLGNGGALIAVADGGPGLTADDRAVAFQRSALYERYRAVRPVGTGLGLALVHALATRLGGSASVTDAPGGGALFAISLPGKI
jgi:two-component system sensor histidine kinase BaeS